MIAVLNTSGLCGWAEEIGGPPWPLLPVANRPLLDYWLELCSELGIETVQVVLGEQAKLVEDYVGDGRRWNLKIDYAFARSAENSARYLRSVSSLWQEGLLYFGNPFFIRRRQAFRVQAFGSLDACCYGASDDLVFLYARMPADVEALLEGGAGSERGLEQVHAQPWIMDSIVSYFNLNMKLVAGEFTRYTTAGFSSGDSSSVGYNVRTPPSSHLQAPLLIGDNCRFGPMTTIGPNAVVANHVIVDSSTELINCLILPDTYIGRNLDIHGKIVAGNRVISPEDGTVVEIDDSWVVAQNRPAMRTEDFVRYVLLWFVATSLMLLLVIPFLLLFPWVRLSGIARFKMQLFHDPRTGYISLPVLHKLKNRRCVVFRMFKALSLDRLPLLVRVVRGRMFLCGQPPMRHPEDDELISQLPEYYPGVFCYQDYNKESDRLVDSLWYAHIRSLYEDLKILVKSLISRFLRAGH
jgi:lipopolysaccharide/colanic/teichoic acid biosynthesis glycosyltransferase